MTLGSSVPADPCANRKAEQQLKRKYVYYPKRRPVRIIFFDKSPVRQDTAGRFHIMWYTYGMVSRSPLSSRFSQAPDDTDHL